MNAASITEEARIRGAYSDAAAVFSGTLTRVDTLKVRPAFAADSSLYATLGGDSAKVQELINRHSPPEKVRYVFTVSAVWKGGATREIGVIADNLDSSCGRLLDPGEEYLVYADDFGEGLMVNACSRVLPLDEAEKDRSMLRASRAARS